MKCRSAIIFILISSFIQMQTVYSQKSERPNIILIVADDLGYSDIGCYGGEIKTPALDEMANSGIRLPNMYNAGMCVISRSSLLTGQWWPKVGYGIEKHVNLAQKLKQQGYRTGLVGKWHLNGEPNDKGFDYFFGFLGGYSSYFEGSKDYRLNKNVFDEFNNDFYSTDAFSDRSIEFINSKENANDQPFFLYLSYQAPHNPLQASKEDIISYRGSYLKGWQAIRDARIKKQIQLGLVDPETPVAKYPQNLPDWESLSPEQKDMEDLRMSVYAAMVERMDKGIGRLIQNLRSNGQLENTLILFLSDNGTDSFSVMDQEMLKKELLPGDVGSNYQPGTGWAYASVSPHRLYKISQHNGGVKTGAIAYWPAGIKKPGGIQQEVLHVVDIMPTLMDLAMINPESKKESIFAKTLAGKSFASILAGKSFRRKSPIYFQFMDNRAIRTNRWSLVEVDGNGWELYNVRKDPLETNDLAGYHDNKIKDLEKNWLNWWKSESGKTTYEPESTAKNLHYKPQGDRGSGEMYVPSSMPSILKDKY